MEFIYRILLGLIDSGNGRYLTDFNHVHIESWIPLWLIPFVIVGVIGLTLYLYIRNSKRLNRKKLIILTILRSLAYILLLLCLAMPKLVIEGEGVLPGTIPMVVDATQSMTIKDVNDAERTVFAKRLTDNLLKEGEDLGETNIKGYWAGKEFVDYVPGKTTEADGEYTSLPRMLEQGIYNHLGDYCPGMILISDGANNTSDIIDNTVRLFKKRNIPIYTCGVGTSKSTDIAVTYIIGEDVVFISEKAKIYVNVRQDGFTKQKIKLKLYLDDREVYSGSHTLEKDGENSIPVEYKPFAKGVFQLKAVVTPMPGEITDENNTYIKTVRIIDEKIRILMVFGVPSWEYRYLAGAFERDKRVEFKVFMPNVDSRLFRRNATGHFTDQLPKDAKELGKKYDVIFVSAVDMAELPKTFVDALPDFVENSGGLAVLSDPTHIPYSMQGTASEKLLPVILGRGRGRNYRDELFLPSNDPMTFDLTDDGMANQLVLFSGDRDENRKIWNELPPVYSCYRAGRLKPSSITLMVAFQNRNRQRFPAIVHHSYGKGTVLFMAFDSTWRWRKEYGDRYFRDFWGKAIQFLGLPHLLNEAAQSVIFVGQENCYAGEKINIRAKISNSDFSPYVGKTVKLTIRDKKEMQQIEMYQIAGRKGMYRADYVPEEPGEVKLELPAKFNAKPFEMRVMKQQKEFLHSEMNRELLEKISRETGGEYFDFSKSQHLLPALMANRPKQPINVSASLWDSFLLLLVVLIVLTAEWVVRKYCYLD